MKKEEKITDAQLGKLLQSLNKEDEQYVLSAARITEALEKIRPGFERIKNIVEKEKLTLGQAEETNPEQAKVIKTVYEAQNNEGRYNKIVTEIDNKNNSLNIIMDRFKEKGFGQILNMTTTDLINLGDKVKSQLDTRNRIESLEINFEFYEPEESTKRKIKIKP